MCCMFLFTYVLSSKRCELSLASKARGSCVCGAGSRMAGNRDPRPVNCLLLEQPSCTLGVPPQPARAALTIVPYTRDLIAAYFRVGWKNILISAEFGSCEPLCASVNRVENTHPTPSFKKKEKGKKKGTSAAMVTGWL